MSFIEDDIWFLTENYLGENEIEKANNNEYPFNCWHDTILNGHYRLHVDLEYVDRLTKLAVEDTTRDALSKDNQHNYKLFTKIVSSIPDMEKDHNKNILFYFNVFSKKLSINDLKILDSVRLQPSASFLAYVQESLECGHDMHRPVSADCNLLGYIFNAYKLSECQISSLLASLYRCDKLLQWKTLAKKYVHHFHLLTQRGLIQQTIGHAILTGKPKLFYYIINQLLNNNILFSVKLAIKFSIQIDLHSIGSHMRSKLLPLYDQYSTAERTSCWLRLSNLTYYSLAILSRSIDMLKLISDVADGTTKLQSLLNPHNVDCHVHMPTHEIIIHNFSEIMDVLYQSNNRCMWRFFLRHYILPSFIKNSCLWMFKAEDSQLHNKLKKYHNAIAASDSQVSEVFSLYALLYFECPNIQVIQKENILYKNRTLLYRFFRNDNIANNQIKQLDCLIKKLHN